MCTHYVFFKLKPCAYIENSRSSSPGEDGAFGENAVESPTGREESPYLPAIGFNFHNVYRDPVGINSQDSGPLAVGAGGKRDSGEKVVTQRLRQETR